MKTNLKISLAGLLLATLSFASQGDPFKEERFKEKFGQYTLSEQARRNSLHQESAGSKKYCEGNSCCRHEHAASSQQTRSASSAWMNRWFQAKWGRPLNNEPPAITQAKAGEMPEQCKMAEASHQRMTCCN